jgi:hypothetical protein
MGNKERELDLIYLYNKEDSAIEAMNLDGRGMT